MHQNFKLSLIVHSVSHLFIVTSGTILTNGTKSGPILEF